MSLEIRLEIKSFFQHFNSQLSSSSASMFVELVVDLTEFHFIIDEINKDPEGLEGSKLRVKRAPICSSVLVSGLSEKTTGETIQLYFEHRKNGGGDVDRLEYEEGSQTAVVYFKDCKGTNLFQFFLVVLLLVIVYDNHL